MNIKKILGTALLLASASFCTSHAQTSITAAPAIPSQIASAHSVFLGCGGAPAFPSRDVETTTMLYTSAYNALSSVGRYRLTGTPSDADLSMTISIEFGSSDVTHGSSSETNFVRLSIYDTKTHSLLWNIDEPIGGAFRKSSFQKNIDESMAKIVANLNTLAANKLP